MFHDVVGTSLLCTLRNVSYDGVTAVMVAILLMTSGRSCLSALQIEDFSGSSALQWPKKWTPENPPNVASLGGWSQGPDMCHAAEYLFNASREDYDPTHALLIIRRGQLVCERYISSYYHSFHPFWTWSVAKSMVHLLIGILVRQGRVDIHQPAAVYSSDLWPEPSDPRRNITIDQLLRMRAGLSWTEGVDDAVMLFGPGRTDVGAYAASKSMAASPGAEWNYSTGATNIVTRVIRDVVGGPTALLEFLEEEVYSPLGMCCTHLGFDGGGTFVGSSYLSSSVHDLAKIGLLYLRDGVWENRRVLPRGWMDHGRTASFVDDAIGMGYGAHWWLSPRHPGVFFASGTGGQRLYLVPEDELIIVRMGSAAQRSYDQTADGSVHLGCGSRCEQPFWHSKFEPLVDALVDNLRQLRV